MIVAVLTAVVAAVSYGVSDFFASLAARRLGTLVGTTGTYLFATLALGIAALVAGGDWSGGALFWGATAGVTAVVGLLCFYGALAIGPMSVLSPLIAALSSIVPVIGALLLGSELSTLAWVAIGAALVSGLLVSTSSSTESVRISRRALASSLVAGLMLGLSIIALDAAPDDAGIVPALVEIVLGLVLLLGLLLARWVWAKRSSASSPDAAAEPRAPWLRRAVAACAVGGLLLGLSNGLILAALTMGDLAVVSVLIGLYPIATIVLARVVLGERVSALQGVGAALALAATVTLTLS